MSAGDIIALIGAIGGLLGGGAAIGTLWVTVRRGSDRENKRAAAVAVAVAKDSTVTPIEQKRDDAS